MSSWPPPSPHLDRFVSFLTDPESADPGRPERAEGPAAGSAGTAAAADAHDTAARATAATNLGGTSVGDTR
jgi:hypothetical protein